MADEARGFESYLLRQTRKNIDKIGMVWRGDREAEGDRLLICCTALKLYRGFESHPLRKTNAVPPLVERHFLFGEHQARLNDRKIKMPASAVAAFDLTVPPTGINEINPTLSAKKCCPPIGGWHFLFRALRALARKSEKQKMTATK